MENGKWKMENGKLTSSSRPHLPAPNNTPKQYFSIYAQFRIEDMLPVH